MIMKIDTKIDQNFSGITIFPNPVLRDLTTQNFTVILPNIFENVIYPSNFTT